LTHSDGEKKNGKTMADEFDKKKGILGEKCGLGKEIYVQRTTLTGPTFGGNVHMKAKVKVGTEKRGGGEHADGPKKKEMKEQGKGGKKKIPFWLLGGRARKPQGETGGGGSLTYTRDFTRFGLFKQKKN